MFIVLCNRSLLTLTLVISIRKDNKHNTSQLKAFMSAVAVCVKDIQVHARTNNKQQEIRKYVVNYCIIERYSRVYSEILVLYRG